MNPPLRPPRRLAASERAAPAMSAAQQRAQDLSVAYLQDAMAAAERYLAAHPERIEGTRPLLCQCGAVALQQCPCPLRRAR